MAKDYASYRTAFQTSLLQEHRGNNLISSLAVEKQGDRFWVGYSDGVLKEFQIVTFDHGVVAKPSVQIHVSSKGAAVCQLEHINRAGLLAVVLDTGKLLLVDLDKYSRHEVHNIKQVTCIGVRETQHGCFVAIAQHARGVTRVVLGEVSPAQKVVVKDGQVDIYDYAARFVAFADSHVIIGTRAAYHLITSQPTPPNQPPVFNASLLFQIPPPPGYPMTHARALAVSVPGTSHVLLMGPDNMTMLVDKWGVAVPGAGMQLPDVPLGLAITKLYLLAALRQGVAIYDRHTGQVVQQVEVQSTGRYLVDPQQALRLCMAATQEAHVLLVANVDAVWCFRSVSLKQQVHQLLRNYNLDNALALCNAGLEQSSDGDDGDDEDWVIEAMAQLGILYLSRGYFRDGLEVVRRVPSSLLQPAALLKMLPEITKTSLWSEEGWVLQKAFSTEMRKHNAKTLAFPRH